MRFDPPRCPNPECTAHRDPVSRWFHCIGSFAVRYRPEPVQRFRCQRCGRSFSEQTFRADRGDRKPWTNAPLLELLTSGVGLRQCGRLLGLNIRAVQRKLRKLGATCRDLHERLSRKLPGNLTFQFDEEETFEHARSRPLTMPVLIELQTWFVVAADAGPIRRLACAGSARRLEQDRYENEHGPRPDHSRQSVERVLRSLAQRLDGAPLVLQSDEKASYKTLVVEVFEGRAVHQCTAGTDPRTVENPLFPINTTLAMTRDNNGRLRRQSWLVTKKCECLLQQMQLFMVYRNYIRRRFNRDDANDTPAKLLGLVPRALTAGEVLQWRQDWGDLSPDPLTPGPRRPAPRLAEVLAA